MWKVKLTVYGKSTTYHDCAADAMAYYADECRNGVWDAVWSQVKGVWVAKLSGTRVATID